MRGAVRRAIRISPRLSAENILPLGAEWNDLDRLRPETKLLHTMRRRTQPWKTGLPVDFQPPERPLGSSLLGVLNGLRRRMFGEYALLRHYTRHPDRNQERFFFGLLRECLEGGLITRSLLEQEIRQRHVRADIMRILDLTPPPG